MSTEVNLQNLKLPDAKMIGTAFKTVRYRLLTEGGVRLQNSVRTAILQSGMTIRSGKVIGWQAQFRGTGYVAVRPEASSTGSDSPGAITNYLESGHGIRRPGGKTKYYTPRIHKVRVPGFGFYAAAEQQKQALADEIAKRAAAEIAAAIEGGMR